MDVFFGVDYHSHLGTHRGGMAAWDSEIGLQRVIHSIENSPFRTKFETIADEMKGTGAIGCISDSDPQPLLIRSRTGAYALCMIGVIRNADQLIQEHMEKHGGIFDAMTGGKANSVEILASLIDEKPDFAEGIRHAQDRIEGSASILVLKNDGTLIAARDKVGRLPVVIGKDEDGYCVTFESFAAEKLDYEIVKELGPGEIVEISPDSGIRQLVPPGKKMRICAFLWSYYGYPTSSYEGVNVEMMRYRNGHIMARNDAQFGMPEVDYVGGVPDSGTPHAIGYANESHLPFARAFIKYTPTWSRSFTPTRQTERRKVAKMKQIPVPELIQGKNLLFVDDSIVRGTQLQGTVDFLFQSGAKSVHMRSACPPVMFSCKYLNFSRATGEMELIARRVIYDLEGEEGNLHLEEYSDGSTERGKKLRECICEQLHFDTLQFQSLQGVLEAIGLPPENLCTYCWTGKE